MNRKQVIFFIIGALFVGLSVWQIYNAEHGLDIINLHTTNPPVTIITPADAPPASRPTILIAHGFAGSSVLMRGFALTLAYAGYTTVSWDFEGHGTNPKPFALSSDSSDLIINAESALAEAVTTGLIDPQRVAILGHSMGSGVALSYGSLHPDTNATIAISPVSQSVTHTLPHNLMLMAGSLEPQFASNAEQLFSMAGGPNADYASGAARNLVIVPNVEHISILFSPVAQSNARAWLDATYGLQPGATKYSDRRILWFGLGILGFICLSNVMVNWLPTTSSVKGTLSPRWVRVIALTIGSLGATSILYFVSLSGVKLSQLLGVLVGGYLLIWFALAGLTSLLILRPRIYFPKITQIGKGLLAFAALWLGVGLLGNLVWLPWLLIPHRLWLWVPGSILLVPWFFAVGEATKQASKVGQIGWWLFQVIIVMAGFFLAIRLNPELGFLFIILPLVPVMLALHMLAISSRHGSWAFALPGAMFTAWLLLAVFPLQ
jgi:pimeloyl-ACP methyl ester carboxylesterase